MSENAVSGPERRPGEGYDFANALQFVFHDPDWIPKILIGALFSILSSLAIGSIFIMGYVIHLARRTMKGEQYPLPEWDDLGAIFVDGLRGLAVYLGHTLAVALIFIVLVLAFGGALALGEREDNVPHGIEVLITLAILAGYGIFFLLSLAMICYVPAAMVRFIRTDSVGAAFEFGANVEFIKNHSSVYVLALLTIVLASFLAQLGIFLFCIGIFATTFWSSCVAGYALGELARHDSGESV